MGSKALSEGEAGTKLAVSLDLNGAGLGMLSCRALDLSTNSTDKHFGFKICHQHCSGGVTALHLCSYPVILWGFRLCGYQGVPQDRQWCHCPASVAWGHLCSYFRCGCAIPSGDWCILSAGWEMPNLQELARDLFGVFISVFWVFLMTLGRLCDEQQP